MPTLDWLKTAFEYGFDSGNILSLIPNRRRWSQERKIGGSYRRVFHTAIKPYLQRDAIVLELGPGRGSWSRAILKYIPQGKLYTVDFVDTCHWLRPEEYEGRLISYRVQDTSFACLEDDCFDFFWSFGVVCHQNAELLLEILTNSVRKMKPGGIAVHQYADWKKLEKFGWKKGGVPERFKDAPDDEIWWPRNNRRQMANLAKQAGWKVLSEDLGLLDRDGMICLRRDT